jgi:hypothetical protein
MIELLLARKGGKGQRVRKEERNSIIVDTSYG